MSLFMVDPEVLTYRAQMAYDEAFELADLAWSTYQIDPCRANKIALKGCIRLVKERRAVLEEWELDG